MPMTVADILSALTTKPAGKDIWKIPTAGTPGVPWLAPQGAQNMEAPYVYLAPPEPTNQVITMPMPAPPVAVAQPSITPTIPSTYGASASVSGIPNVTIPDVAIPDAPVMSAGMTVEQAIAMGKALAPNVNLQPLTQADIFGSADPRATLGLLPEHLKTLVDMRAGARTQKATEDAAAVALAKQTQGLDVAHDVMKKAPELQAHKDVTVYDAKAKERLTAQKAKTDRDTKQAELSLDRLKLLAEVSKKSGNYVDMLNNEKARIQLLAGTPGGERQITEAQARMAKLTDEMPDNEALTFYNEYMTNLGLLPPELRAKMTLPPDMLNRIMLKADRALGNTNAFTAVGTTFTPKTAQKTGGK